MSSAVGFLIIWVPVLFAVMVAAAYVGAKLALQSYFDGHDPFQSESRGTDAPEDGQSE